ncbi:hypothetical protein ACWDY7_32235 [Streptomyces calvus]|uniref:Uncharacterized protein n=1 Tax=Streptomyces calvus TaxID=67282 RepID=A0AA40VLA5_9ACTN|nr:hypothetical protein [Streptomyces calvus]MBA8948184.1 hypothetical protein [Streptomyces calvus]GGP84052.1 hypothetical protein GCM10010247_66770 [Streptomyces calvus]
MLRAYFGSAIDTAQRAGSALALGVGRIATIAGAGAAGAGLFIDQPTVPALVTTVALGVGGAFLSPRLVTSHPQKRPIATFLYLTPHGFLSSILIAELVATSTQARLIEGGAVLLWTAGVWWLRPAALGKRVAKWNIDPEPEVAEETDGGEEPSAEVAVAEDLPDDPAARWWAIHAAKDGGVAPDTTIIGIERIEDGRRVAVALGSKTPGEPVPEIKLRRLSALMNLPVSLLEVQDIPGYGAGVAMLLIGPKPEASIADEDVWAEISRTALPGVQLVEVNEYDLSKELNP